MVIDIHAHYYPPEYLERIGRPELPPSEAAPLASQSVEERLELLDRFGVDAQVLSVSQAQPYLPVATGAADAAALVNDLTVELSEKHPGRFFTFASLPLPHVDASLAELDRVFGADPVVGVSVGCSVAGLQLDDPVLEPVFDELDRRRAVVFVHPIGQETTPWLAGRNLAWLVGAPFEDTVAALRLVLGGVVERHPNIAFIVPHLGGTIPFLLARLTTKGGERIHRGLQSLYYDTVSGSADALVSSARALGTSRLLLGTDYPYCDADQFAGHLEYLDHAHFGTDALAAVKGGTAAHLLALDR